MKTRRLIPVVISGTILLLLSIIVSLLFGTAEITAIDTIKIFINQFLNIFDKSGFPVNSNINILAVRLPRVLGAGLSGIGLALSGIIFQSILRNPLAEPYILGVSSGAALGAGLSIILNVSVAVIPIVYMTPFFALSGALLSSFVVILVSGNSSNSSNKIILYGVSLNFFLSSLLALLISLNIDRSREYLYWSMGRFTTMNDTKVIILFLTVVLAAAITLYHRRELNLFTMGLPVAKSLGLNVRKYRILLLSVASIVTGLIVSFAGIIGFTGLVIPHLARIFVGSEHRRVILFSIPLGGIFMIVCDTISRSALSNGLPVGIVTSLIGAPVFIFLLKRRSRL